MNGAQQAQRRTAVLDLQDQITKLAEAFDAELKDVMAGLIDRDSALTKETRDLFNADLLAEVETRRDMLTQVTNDLTSEIAEVRRLLGDVCEEMRDRLLRFESLHFATGWRGIWKRFAWIFMGGL